MSEASLRVLDEFTKKPNLNPLTARATISFISIDKWGVNSDAKMLKIPAVAKFDRKECGCMHLRARRS